MGEAIESRWSTSPEEPKKYQSGTSFATPIAVGIAANLMLYARMNLSEKIAQKIRTVAGMKRLLKSVSLKGDNNYHYLGCPQHYWGSSVDLDTHLKFYFEDDYN